MTDPATEPTEGRRTVVLVLFTLLGVLVGAVGLLAILMPAGALTTASGHMNPGHSTTSTTTGSPTGTPSQAMGMGVGDIIEMHLPEQVATMCNDGMDEHHSVAGGFAYADVDCKPEGWTVEYAAFHDAEAMRLRFRSDIKNHRIPKRPAATACRDALSAGYGPFWMNATRANHGAGSHQLERGQLKDWTHGAVLCFTHGGTRTIEWYDSDTHIFAWAQGSSDSAEQLFDWWINQGGPNHPSMSDMSPSGDQSSSTPVSDASPSPSESGSDMPMPTSASP